MKIVLLLALIITLVLSGCNVTVPLESTTDLEPNMPSADSENTARTVNTSAQISGVPPHTQVHVVEIRQFAFNPSVLAVGVGDTVRFMNEDTVSHTVSCTSGQPCESGILRPSSAYELVIESSNPIEGKCSIHPSMTFTLLVE